VHIQQSTLERKLIYCLSELEQCAHTPSLYSYIR